MNFIKLSNTIINLDQVSAILDHVGLWLRKKDDGYSHCEYPKDDPPNAPGFEWNTDCMKVFFAVQDGGKCMEMILNPEHSVAMREYFNKKAHVYIRPRVEASDPGIGGSSEAETPESAVKFREFT